jgi:hypothetical protein
MNRQFKFTRCFYAPEVSGESTERSRVTSSPNTTLRWSFPIRAESDEKPRVDKRHNAWLQAGYRLLYFEFGGNKLFLSGN